jgi:hypothetical protein
MLWYKDRFRFAYAWNSRTNFVFVTTHYLSSSPLILSGLTLNSSLIALTLTLPRLLCSLKLGTNFRQSGTNQEDPVTFILWCFYLVMFSLWCILQGQSYTLRRYKRDRKNAARFILWVIRIKHLAPTTRIITIRSYSCIYCSQQCSWKATWQLGLFIFYVTFFYVIICRLLPRDPYNNWKQTWSMLFICSIIV